MISIDNPFWCLFQKTKRIFSETFKELVRETKTGKSSEPIPNNESKIQRGRLIPRNEEKVHWRGDAK